MANRSGCNNGTLDGVDYSSPVPVIGLYIAAGSLGSLIFMLYDVVVAGILPRKPWLPCKFFALNSVTLTLLSVASKLTVDLTTSMPSHWDQLSKLTGTAFICICMGFLAPSIGVNSESDCFTNMMALTIFVITVMVNICIQLSTGVIFVFFVEHIIILGLMLLLLLMLWHISLEIKSENRIASSGCTTNLNRGPKSMFERFKLCYLHAYSSNPQLKISTYPMNISVGSICVACTTIIVEAGFRSLIQSNLECYQGVSDYSWSMRYIVITQVVTIILGPIPIVVRGVGMSRLIDLDYIFAPFRLNADYVKQMNRTLKAKRITLHKLLNLFRSIITKVVLIAQALIVSPWWVVRHFFCTKFDGNAASGYILRRSIDNMIRLKGQVSKSNSIYHPSLYLSQKSPSPYLDVHSMKIKDGPHQIEITTLSMALLVKIAEASIPKHLLVSLQNAFREAKEVVHYISNALPPHRGQNYAVKGAYARDVWTGGDLTCMIPGHIQAGMDIRVAIDTINKLKETLHEGDVWRDLGILVDFINRRSYSSVEELCEAIEQLFADMLHAFFAQLPVAICNSLSKTQGEEFEEGVRVAMKMLFRIGILECQRNWVFPANMSSIAGRGTVLERGTNIARLNQIVLAP